MHFENIFGAGRIISDFSLSSLRWTTLKTKVSDVGEGLLIAYIDTY